MIYVDTLSARGFAVRGLRVRTCHCFSDQGEDELRAFAQRIGLPTRWLQRRTVPHFDLTTAWRANALVGGARELSNRDAAKLWRTMRMTEPRCSGR